MQVAEAGKGQQTNMGCGCHELESNWRSWARDNNTATTGPCFFIVKTVNGYRYKIA